VPRGTTSICPCYRMNCADTLVATSSAPEVITGDDPHRYLEGVSRGATVK